MSKGTIDIIVCIVVIILFVVACSVSTGSDDDSAMNCVWFIVLLLAWLRGGGK